MKAPGGVRLLSFVLLCAVGQAFEGPPSTPMSPADAAKHCAQFEPLYSNIDNDLSRWSADGISLSVMQVRISSACTACIQSGAVHPRSLPSLPPFVGYHPEPHYEANKAEGFCSRLLEGSGLCAGHGPVWAHW